MEAPQALFERDGDRFSPTELSLSPWGSDRLHGGPVLGLLVHVAEQAVGDPRFALSRLTADLFAPVPFGPLSVGCEVLRAGRRLRLLQASVYAGDREVTRASLLFLKPGQGTFRVLDATTPAGPDGCETRSLIGEGRRTQVPPGFHKQVETRWAPSEPGDPKAIWFRMPMPLLPDLPRSPTVAAAALSDFNNAVASITAFEQGRAVAHINTDTTLYLERPPRGEWFCLLADGQSDADAISITQVAHYDREGRFGHSLQARLENKFSPPSDGAPPRRK